MNELQVRHLAIADECLAAGRSLVVQEMFRSAANRAYFASYHIALALIDEFGSHPRTHRATRRAFAALAMRRLALPPVYGSILVNLGDLRRIADYATHRGVEAGRARSAVRYAAAFRARAGRLLAA